MGRARRLIREHEAPMRALLEHVRANGPVRAADFEAEPGARAGWWEWKKEKRWLEAWFALGELMIARRENFHRVYDLTSRVHPASDALPLPSAAGAARVVVERAVRALGVTQARWIHDYFRTRPRVREEELAPMLEDGTLVEAEVEGWNARGFVHRDHVALARRLAAGALAPSHTTLLSPFDPVVWDRARAAAMFGFDYRLECYVPAPKRRYGYYVLPILRRGALVGRLDAKAHRADGIFEVRSLHLEPGVRPGEALLRDVASAIASCAAWHGTAEVRITRTAPAAARRPLAALVERSAAARRPGAR
jgi:uncharacterized protein YcaQ